MPSLAYRITQHLYKYRFDLLFASIFFNLILNILFPNDIYGGMAQAIYLPFQLVAGLFIFNPRKKRLVLILVGIVGLILILGRAVEALTMLDIREVLVFVYVLFFGWIMLEVFYQSYAAPMVDRESVLAALCGLLLIGYCGFFVFVAVEIHQPGSFVGIASGTEGLRDLFYFSYVTILTIGYGDITPHTWVAKNATILVALIAYMYSLVIVAMIVSQFAEIKKMKRLARVHSAEGGQEPKASGKGTLHSN